jgi:alpha-glucosidase (family GH31 glycosyl hydrolase)
MDVQIKKGETMTYHVVGGVLDFIFFAGDASPETSISQYHNYLGGWKLFPFWSFGFHQCRWGYRHIDRLINVIDNYNKNDLPLDVIWSDIDYMQNYIDFTVDWSRFPKDKYQTIYNSGKRYVPIIDAGIARGGNTDTYRQGLDKQVYLKNYEGDYLDASVWPGAVYFPDFFHPNTDDWWGSGLGKLKSQVDFKGIWLDMNEVSNFCEGQCNWRSSCNGPFDLIPYTPTGGDLHSKTVRMDSKHYSKTSNPVYEYNVHNFFGFMESKATHDFLKKQDDLTFVLSRSTAPGSGKYTAHWLGDNDATWEWLRLSISGTMTFNLFGVPMTGADICGFNSHTTENLCARWMQVGNLYPFARNHNHNDFKDQEPYALGSTVLETSRIALRLRYSMLKFYYSLFVERFGRGTIFRPIFFEFPQDPKFFEKGNKYTDSQFLLGKSIMVTPVLHENTVSVDAYFPRDDWYNYFTGEMVHCTKEEGKVQTISAPLNATIPMFLRGGHIVHTQKADSVMRTDDLDNKFSLLVALKGNSNAKSAKGSIMALKDYNDSNIVNKCESANCLLDINVQYEQSEGYIKTYVAVTAQDSKNLNNLEDVGLYQIHFYGISYEQMSEAVILLNGKQLDNAFVKKVEGRDYPVVYLPDITIKHEDIILIEKVSNLYEY